MPQHEARFAVDWVNALGAELRELQGKLPERVVVGYSGGLDSSVLLHLVSRWQQQTDTSIDLLAVHVHHGQSKVADDWHHFCAAQCGTLALPCLIEKLHLPPTASEGVMRQGRYSAFQKHLSGPGDVLLLAHHADDQAETLLLRTLQGRGSQGMPRQRPCGQGHLLRPLLGYSRSTLAEYAQCYGLQWVEDPSNQSTVADRNWVRQVLMPELTNRWPDVKTRLGAAAQAGQQRERLVTALVQGDQIPRRMARSTLQDQALAPDLLRNWLQAMAVPGLRLPSQRQLVELARQLAHSSQAQLRLNVGTDGTQGWSLRGYRSHLYLVPPTPVLAATYEVPMRLDAGFVTAQTHELPHGTLRFQPMGEKPGPEPISWSVVVRCLEDARERAHSPKFWQSRGVPAWLRASYPQLVAESGAVIVPLLCWQDTPALELVSKIGSQPQLHNAPGLWLWTPH